MEKFKPLHSTPLRNLNVPVLKGTEGLKFNPSVPFTLQDKFGLDEMRVESSDGGDQASLVVGRYLSPQLYVSYGVGLIESINTFSLRYQLSSKWQLKAENGANQSADLFYTIER